jgi:biofilm PGA synthesis N-glycosyltransferase PgaC
MYLLSVFLIILGYGWGYFHIFQHGFGPDVESDGLPRTIPSERVNVVIPVRDEACLLRAKLVNLCSQSYPTNLLDVIVVDSSGGSLINDALREVVDSHANLHVTAVRNDTGKGKYYSLNLAFRTCTDDYVIISDVDVLAQFAAIEKLIQNFRNVRVGAVSAMETTKSEFGELSAYRSLYNILRLAESQLGSVLMCESGLAAYRRELLGELPEDVQCDDLALTAQVLSKGYRTIYDAGALFHENQEGLTRSGMLLQKLRRARANISALMSVASRRNNFPTLFQKVILPFEMFIHIEAPALFLVCAASLLCLAIYDGVETFLLLGILPLATAAVAAVVMSAKVSGNRGALRTGLAIVFAFVEYNAILLIGLALAIIKGPQTKWKR